MCQNCNQNNCNGCTQEVTICNQCPPETCDCPILGLSTDCSTYTADDIECNSVVVVAKNTILSDALNNIVSWSCTKFSELANYLRIINVGIGADVYAGDNLIGEKKIRRIKSTDNSVTITQGTNDIDLSVVGNLTYSASNIGTGAQVYKDSTVVGANTQFNLRKINTFNSGAGNIVLKPQVENTNDISIIAKSLLVESQGEGVSVIKDLQANIDDNKLRLKSLTSTSLNITTTDDEISVEVPAVTDIPALIVNSAYTGVEELGTKSKPFKTIQSALDAYKGTGGKGTIADPTNPEKIGTVIEVEKGSGTYIFTGDFNYKDLNISLKEGANIQSNPVDPWLADFTKFSTTTTHNTIITIGEGAYIACSKNGFRLEGGDFLAGTGNRKLLVIRGVSSGGGIVLDGTIESDILFEIDGANLQYVNGGFQHAEITVPLYTKRGRMFVIKGNGNVVYNDSLLYFLTDSATAIITNTYPIIEMRNNAILKLSKAKVFVNETPTVTYTQLISTYDSALFQAIDSLFEGISEYFAYSNTIANTAIVKLDSCKMYMVTNTSFAGTISGVWANMALTNNTMPNTTIDSLTTEIYPSAVNTIGAEIIETLNTYASKAAAVTAGLPVGAKFINKIDITAGSFVVGVEYKILTIGTTDFTLIGATANTVGLYFTATGTGTGDGTASLIRVDIVI